eukprot:g1882.t1
MGLGVVNPNPYSGMGFDYFPMYCPMLACNTTYIVYERPEDQPRYMESTGMNGFFAIRERVQVDDSFFYIFRALAMLAEAVRLMICSMRYEFCAATTSGQPYNRSDPFSGYAAHDYHTFMRNEACSVAANSFVILNKHLDGVLQPLADGSVKFCEELFLKRAFTEMLLRVPSVLLDSVVRKVTSGVSLEPPTLSENQDAPTLVRPLGNDGTRFDFEMFFNDTRQYWDVPYDARRFAHIRYPSSWSPMRICKAGRFEQVIPGYASAPLVKYEQVVEWVESLLVLVAQDTEETNKNVTRGWVLNFGAADGACGLAGDWNHDPANCLLRGETEIDVKRKQEDEVGSGVDSDVPYTRSGMVIEGDPDRIPDLVTAFAKHEKPLTRFLRPLKLEDVEAEVRKHVLKEKEWRGVSGSGSSTALTRRERLQTFLAESPVLLKMDIDNADCTYMERALRVVRPLVIFFEIWADIPPPFDYRENYRPPYSPAAYHAAGCSLMAFVNIGKKFGYSLTEVLLEDGVLVRDDVLLGTLDVFEQEDANGSPARSPFAVPFFAEVESEMKKKVLSQAVESAFGRPGEEPAEFDFAQENGGDGGGELSAVGEQAETPAAARDRFYERLRPLPGLADETTAARPRSLPVPYGFSFYDGQTGNGRVYVHRHLDLSVYALYTDGFFCHPKAKWLVRPEKDTVDWAVLMDSSTSLQKRADFIHEVMRARRWKAGLRGSEAEDRSKYTLEWPE